MIIPVAEVEGFGLNVAIDFGVEFNLPRKGNPPLHGLFGEKPKLKFEIGIIGRVETSAKACSAFEGHGANGC